MSKFILKVVTESFLTHELSFKKSIRTLKFRPKNNVVKTKIVRRELDA